MVDLHDARENEAVDLRAQATDVGREFEREHGDGAIGKINAGTAQASFLIEGGAGRDVLGDVGDVYVQFAVAIREHVHVNGVVEVARGFSVDGDDGKRAEVAAAMQLVTGDDGGRVLGFLKRGGRKW